MAGAGHGDFSRLVADEAKVIVEGVGSVIVHPKDTLDATMNGVGAILYTGNPREVNTRMNGLGTIARRDAKDDRTTSEHEDARRPGRAAAGIRRAEAEAGQRRAPKSFDVGRSKPDRRAAPGTCRRSSALRACHCSFSSSCSRNDTSPPAYTATGTPSL